MSLILSMTTILTHLSHVIRHTNLFVHSLMYVFHVYDLLISFLHSIRFSDIKPITTPMNTYVACVSKFGIFTLCSTSGFLNALLIIKYCTSISQLLVRYQCLGFAGDFFTVGDATIFGPTFRDAPPTLRDALEFSILLQRQIYIIIVPATLVHFI